VHGFPLKNAHVGAIFVTIGNPCLVAAIVFFGGFLKIGNIASRFAIG
jgi:UDP-3-O-[3-hydroxymyristoyl] glucosamine N-acyltransferase